DFAGFTGGEGADGEFHLLALAGGFEAIGNRGDDGDVAGHTRTGVGHDDRLRGRFADFNRLRPLDGDLELRLFDLEDRRRGAREADRGRGVHLAALGGDQDDLDRLLLTGGDVF